MELSSASGYQKLTEEDNECIFPILQQMHVATGLVAGGRVK
jgi:hypothetical protein